MAVDLRWQQDAACVGTPDHELFQLVEKGNQLAAEMLPHELWQFNRDNFDYVQSTYCSVCPARNACWAEGERTGDALWSVRGGADPIAFPEEQPDLPSNQALSKVGVSAWVQVDGVWVCRKAGHVRDEGSVWYRAEREGVVSASMGYCIDCRQVTNRNRPA